MMLHEALEKVKDKTSFLEFLEILISDREKAETLENENPDYWQWGGANGWQNSSISSFLGAASCCFDETENEDVSWKTIANFLYYGKIYE